MGASNWDVNLKESGLPVMLWLSEGVIVGVVSIWLAHDMLVPVLALMSMLYFVAIFYS